MSKFCTFDDIKLEMSDESLDEMKVNKTIEEVSAFIRSTFSKIGIDIEKELEADPDRKLLVKAVVVDLVVNKLHKLDNPLPFGGAFNSVTETLNDISVSYSNTFGFSGNGLFLSKTQRKMLGLPSASVRSYNLY